MNKKHLYSLVVNQLEERLNALSMLQDELREALTKDSKSSAGDKYETSRAMTHLEQEKLLQQQQVFKQMKARLSSLDPEHTHKEIGFGSLVETSHGWYFFSIAIGEIVFDQTPVFVLSNAAPLAQALLGKKAGEKLVFQGKEIAIVGVC